MSAAHAPLPPSLPTEDSIADVARLGQALKQRAEEVLEQTVARTIGSGEIVDPLVQENFERICASSTLAVARWIAGEGLEVTSDAAQETSQIFGELAARRAASLNEVTRRSLWWRNVMAEILRESAAEIEAPARGAFASAGHGPDVRRVQPAANV